MGGTGRSYEQPVRGVDTMYDVRVPSFKPSEKLRVAVLAILLYYRMQARRG